MADIHVEETSPKKPNEVDLDMDNAQEQDVEIKEQATEKKEEKPNLNVGEVDLGYTDHSKDKIKAEVKVEEVQEEEQEEKKSEPKKFEQKQPANLKRKKEDYQYRIDRMTFKIREAQRREKAAIDYAKGLQKKFDLTQQKYNQSDEQYLKEFDARVDAQREQVKAVLKSAIEAQDSEKIMEANDKLTQLAVQKEKARLEIEHRAELKKQEQEEEKEKQNNQQQNVEANTSSETNNTAPQQISKKAKEWAQNNPWYGNDEVMTNAAQTIHANVITEGIEVDSDEYYNEINARLKRYFPTSFADDDEQPKKEQRKPVQTVASAGRQQDGRRTVKLTASQVAIAKRLNVPLEEYAKYVKEEK